MRTMLKALAEALSEVAEDMESLDHGLSLIEGDGCLCDGVSCVVRGIDMTAMCSSCVATVLRKEFAEKPADGE